MFGGNGRFGDNFDLLQRRRRCVLVNHNRSAAIGSGLEAVQHQPIELIIGDLRPNGSLVTLLPALLAFLLARFRASRGFDEI